MNKYNTPQNESETTKKIFCSNCGSTVNVIFCEICNVYHCVYITLCEYRAGPDIIEQIPFQLPLLQYPKEIIK